MAKAPAKDKFELIVQYLEQHPKWLSPIEVADALKQSRTGTGTRLRAMAGEGKVQTVGNRRGLRYAALGLEEAPPGASRSAAPAEPEPPAKKKRRKASRLRPGPKIDPASRIEREPQLPAIAPEQGKLVWAINSDGVVAINDGGKTIQLAPADIEYGVLFLERTQLIWKRAA
jgi:hypothetical protein